MHIYIHLQQMFHMCHHVPIFSYDFTSYKPPFFMRPFCSIPGSDLQEWRGSIQRSTGTGSLHLRAGPGNCETCLITRTDLYSKQKYVTPQNLFRKVKKIMGILDLLFLFFLDGEKEMGLGSSDPVTVGLDHICVMTHTRLHMSLLKNEGCPNMF